MSPTARPSPPTDDGAGPRPSNGSARRRSALAIVAGVAGVALLRAVSRRRVAQTGEPEAAPELIRSDVVGGVLMRWEEHGEERPGTIPVVLVHGIPTHPRLWRFVIPELRAPDLRCIAWEMVGFGWSIPEGRNRDISVSRQAVYLGAFLRHLKLDRVLLVGHDVGGGVVQCFAAMHPERSLGLVLADSIAYDNWPVPPVRGARALNRLLERLPAHVLGSVMEPAVRVLGRGDARRRARSAELHIRPYRTPSGPEGLARQLRHLDRDDTRGLAGVLAGTGVPARVIWGAQDMLSLASGERLAADLDAPLCVIADGRHFTPEDHPEVVARAIDELASEARLSSS